MDFKRSLSPLEFNKWLTLKDMLDNFAMNRDERDKVLWGLDPKGVFTTRSLYNFKLSGGFPNRVAGIVWKSKLPLKIKFFLWQVFNNKLQCSVSLVKRG